MFLQFRSRMCYYSVPIYVLSSVRQELFHLQRELLRERTRNSVLLEQRKPINIHRWRCLEVTKNSFHVYV